MKIKLLGSSFGDSEPRQFASSYVINDVIAVDAGCLGFALPLAQQRTIRHVVLSHSHIDHTGSLPIFLDNVYGTSDEPVIVYGGDSVLDCLRECMFNDRVWPDLERLSDDERSFMSMQPIKSGTSFELGETRITPVDLDHAVPTMGFVIEDADAAVVLVSDTAPTHEIWTVASSLPNLKAVFLEASFPNQLSDLAAETKHLTPEMFRGELQKLGKPVRAIAVHIKPTYHDEIVDQLAALDLPKVEVGTPGNEYSF